MLNTQMFTLQQIVVQLAVLVFLLCLVCSYISSSSRLVCSSSRLVRSSCSSSKLRLLVSRVLVELVSVVVLALVVVVLVVDKLPEVLYKLRHLSHNQ